MLYAIAIWQITRHWVYECLQQAVRETGVLAFGRVVQTAMQRTKRIEPIPVALSADPNRQCRRRRQMDVDVRRRPTLY